MGSLVKIIIKICLVLQLFNYFCAAKLDFNLVMSYCHFSNNIVAAAITCTIKNQLS